MYRILFMGIGVPARHLPKLLRIMRLTTFLLFTAFMQVSAKGLAQKVSLNSHHASLKTVIKQLRQQSGYDFVYSEQLMELALPVDLHLTGADFEDALAVIFSKQQLTYTIQDNTVVITRRKTPPTAPLPQAAPAEDIAIHGKVVDEQGNPLPGVTVSIKDTKRLTITNANGEYTLLANSARDTVLFTSIGMQTTQQQVGNRTEINVTLKISSTLLGEIKVNTGYQAIKKEQMTGAAVTVTSADLEQRYQPNIINNLEGRVPGLVSYNGNLQIRGQSTLTSSLTNILIVVDGLPMEGPIENINPYDVESMTVLKDAAAAAIYGARASNGVIVIETKRAKAKGTTVEASADVTATQKPDINFHLLTPEQTVDLENSYWNYRFLSGDYPSGTQLTASNLDRGNPVTPIEYAYYQYSLGNITQDALQQRIDNFKQNNFRKQYKDNVLRTGLLQQYNFAVRTNSERHQSSVVANYKTDNLDAGPNYTSGMINAYNRQLNLTYKGVYFPTNWANLEYGVNAVMGYSNASNNGFNNSINPLAFAYNPYNTVPYQQLIDATGTPVLYASPDNNEHYSLPETTNGLQSLLVNHMDEMGRDRIKTRLTNTRYWLNLHFRLIPGLSFNPQFQYENNQTHSSAYSEAESYNVRFLRDLYASRSGTAPNYSYTYLIPNTGGMLATNEIHGDFWTARGQLNYIREIGKHSFSVVGGTEFRQTHTSGTRGLLLGYDDQLQSQAMSSVNFTALTALKNPTLVKPTYGLSTISNALNSMIGLNRDQRHRFASGYATGSYTFDRRYTLFGEVRKDYADVFGLDPKFRGKPLWSTGAGWNVHNEKFLAQQKWINFLKLRTSYGITGNVNTNSTSYLVAQTATANNTLTGLPSSGITSPANNELRWEKTATFNVGIDFSLFQSSLTGSIDWYRKKSTDLFADTRLDPTSGFTLQALNNASVRNNGIELQLNYSWLRPETRSGFGWKSSLVVSHNDNKIVYVDQPAITPLQLVQGSFRVGKPISALYSFQYKGMNADGQPQWLDGQGKLTTVALQQSDLGAVIYSGQLDPKNNIAFSNIITWKGFNLNILAVYYGGQVMRAEQGAAYELAPSSALPSYVLKSWTPNNLDAIYPGFGRYYPKAPIPGFYLNYSDAFVRKGDFIRIRNARLGYDLSQWLAHKIGAGSFNVHAQVNNPGLLWRKNKIEIDPETGGAPLQTSFVFGLTLRY
jgi:TonB-linked SusC/RagA family outer membrane protein